MFGLGNGMGKLGTNKSISPSMRKRRRAKSWACEFLETRRLFATVSWVTQGDGDWSVGSNWSTGNVPQAGDNVVIDVPNVLLTVTYDGAPVLALGNLVNTESLLLDGSGGATWNGGTWDGSGVVTNLTQLSIGGSADKIIKDGESIENAGMIAMSGTGNIVGQVGASIINEEGATFDLQSDADIVFPAGVGDGIFENAGTVMKSVGGTAAGDSSQIGGPQGFTFENSINDTADLTRSIPGLVLVQQGTLQLGDTQDTSLTEGGSFQISSGATLDYSLGQSNIVVLRPPNGAPQVIPSITGDGNGTGTLEISGGGLQMYGICTVHEIDVSAGDLQFQQNMQETAGTSQRNSTPVTPYATTDILNLSGGTIGGNGGGIFSAPAPIDHEEEPALVVGTTFDWTGGSMSGTGRLVVDATDTSATISGTTPKSVDGGFGLDLLTQVIWTDSGTITMTGGSAIYVHGGGTLWDQANGTITQGTIDNLGGNVWNAGIILKEDGTGTTTFGPGIAVINDEAELNFVTGAIPIIQYPDPGNTTGLFAKIDIRSGTVSLQGTSINRNTISIHPGATLSYDAGTHQNQTYSDSNDVIDASILGVDGGGTVNFGSAVFSSDSQSLVDVPTATFGTGSYSFDNTAAGAQRITTGTFTGNASGIITGSGTIEVTGSFLWNSGQFTGTGGTTSTLLIDSGAVLTLESGSYQTNNQYSIVNDGTLQWATSAGLLTINGNYTQASTGIFDSALANGMFDGLSVSGTVTIAGTLNLSVDSTTVTGGEIFTLIDNTGTLPIAGTFSNYTEGEVFTIGGDKFSLSYVGGTGNDLVLEAIVTPVVTIATPSVLVRPLAGLADLNFTVTLSVATNNNVTVTYTTTPGTAIAGTDYLTTDGILTIPAGATTGTISVPITGTALVELTRTFTLTLSNPTESVLGTPHSAVGTIAARNGPPALSFSTTAYFVDENGEDATIVVTTSDPAIASTVQYATADGTAIAGVDYTAVSGTLTFNPGVSSLSFTVPIIDEGLLKGLKNFTVNLSNPTGSGATLGTATASVGIVDDDGNKPSISIGNASVMEYVFGQVDEVFTLTLSKASAVAVSVQYATADGTATAGKYVPQSGTVTLQPGQLTAQITVPINSDFVQNSTETYAINLSNPVEVSLGVASGIGTILSQPVTTVEISNAHPFRYIDAFGARATISLSGVGTGIVTYLGPVSDDGKQVVLSDTTAQSVLTISTSAGETAVVNIIDDSSLGAINAPTTRLQGNVTIGGGLRTLRLYSLVGENDIDIGTGAKISSLSASFGTVTDATLSSALPLASLHFTSWQDEGSGAGIIAPSAKAIHSTKDFQANITLTGNLDSLVVGGAMTNSVIRVDGNITSLTASTVSGSDIFAGVLSGVGTLPTLDSDFSDTTSSILHLSVTSRKAGAFADSLIAAPIVGTVSLSKVTVNNGGSHFGVAGISIRSVTGTGSASLRQTEKLLLASPFSDNDLYINLTTES